MPDVLLIEESSGTRIMGRREYPGVLRSTQHTLPVVLYRYYDTVEDERHCPLSTPKRVPCTRTMGFKNVMSALAIVAVIGLVSMAMSMQEMVLDDDLKHGFSYDSAGTQLRIENGLLENEESKKVRTAARFGSIPAEVVERKASERKFKTATLELAVGGGAEETTLETKESEMTVAREASATKNEMMLSESSVSAAKHSERK